MKQGDTITFSGEFETINDLNTTDYVVQAMIYCQDAKAQYKKLLYGSNYDRSVAPYNNFHGGLITFPSTSTYTFTMTPGISSQLQGECQIEISVTHSGATAISDNYATFTIQNSVLGTSLNG